MRMNYAAAIAALAIAAVCSAAVAEVAATPQAPQTPIDCSNGTAWVACRSVAALAPTGQATLAVTTASASVAFGSTGPTALITNNGTSTAYIALGTSGVAATTAGTPINAAQSVALDIGANTYLAAITASGTASLAITTGTGLPAIAGGGSGGGGGTVTQGTQGSSSSPWFVQQTGTPPLPTGASTSSPQLTVGGALTRPSNTTAYAFGALMASSTTAGSIVVPTAAVARANNTVGAIVSVTLAKSSNATTNAIFRIHLFSQAPTFTAGDGGTFQGNFTTTGYLGAFDVSVDQSGTSGTGSVGQGAPKIGAEVPFTPAGGTQNIYWVLEARAAYTPTSGETFTPTFETR